MKFHEVITLASKHEGEVFASKGGDGYLRYVFIDGCFYFLFTRNIAAFCTSDIIDDTWGFENKKIKPRKPRGTKEKKND